MKEYNQLINRAKIFFNSGQFFDAQKCLLNILKNFDLDLKMKSNLYLLLGDTNSKLNYFLNSNSFFFKYLAINPNDPKVHNLIANNYSLMGKYEEAEKNYLKAIELKKNNKFAIINLAILLNNLGRKSEALEFYRIALKIDPYNLAVLFNMFKLDKSILNDEKKILIEKSLNLESQNNFNKASGYFLLAEYEKIRGNIKNEVLFLEKANKYSFKSKKKINDQAINYWLNIIPKKFDKFNLINKLENHKIEKNYYPIFIVGLPRSGSTLTEKIISSEKNDIRSFGETNLVNWSLLNNHKNNLIGNEDSVSLDLDLIKKKLINSYENIGLKKNNSKIQFIDKSLENFFYISLILKIFPNSKFIHTFRNLEDNVFSIYKEFLNKISWTHSLEHILAYIDNYQKVIKKFKKVYNKNILSISLEELTEKPRNTAKEIYKFCNLEWDENCLNFHKNKNLFSSTASNEQIRAGIRQYDAKQYKKYKFLIQNFKSIYKWI